ncbi:bifunctional 4-hydroxy-2-oxoglutarate aldolase/2-dehydro-3-deoxy-phosphogluconate aldolase [Halopseudomonas salegens]|nr:bifunctional 4-hydroxy-2-oxoglutarate aldolase/2-dehydro-3-deoxy-phosphogluconate aldolase [Halopseudomonas salegens]
MAKKVEAIDLWCNQARILPVVTIEREEHILPLADALAAGGLRVLEVTLRTPIGLDAIQLLRKERPELIVGAGTIRDTNMFTQAESAGAQFIVSPGSTPELLEAGLNSPVPLIPGVATASDVMAGYARGYRRFKLFPAEMYGGIGALKGLGGPFEDIRFCPTGGISAKNAAQYLAQPNVMCVGGTWMLEAENVRQANWRAVETATKAALAACGTN